MDQQIIKFTNRSKDQKLDPRSKVGSTYENSNPQKKIRSTDQMLDQKIYQKLDQQIKNLDFHILKDQK